LANTALNRTEVALLTNKSGGSVAQGDTVILDSSTATSFTTTTSASQEDDLVGVVLEPNGIANNAAGLVALAGYVPKITLASSASLGDYVYTHTVAKQAQRSGTKSTGAFGQVLSTGTSPAAILFGGLPKQSASSSLDINGLSEDTSPDGTADFVPTYDASAGSNKKVKLNNLFAPQGFIVGLEVDAAGANDDWTVQPGSCRDAAHAATLTRTTAAGTLTGDLGTTGANALDTGTKANSTWYAVFIIRKSSDGTIATLASTSDTAPTMPAGYDQKRRIGWIKTDGSGNCQPQWTRRGDGNQRLVFWRGDLTAAPFRVANNVNLTLNTWTDVDCSGAAPSTSRAIIAHALHAAPSALVATNWREKGITAQQLRLVTTASAGYTSNHAPYLPIDTSRIGQVWDNNIAATDNLYIDVLGYYDSLVPSIV